MKLISVKFSNIGGTISLVTYMKIKETDKLYITKDVFPKYDNRFKKENKDKIDKKGVYYEVVENDTLEDQVLERYFEKYKNLDRSYCTYKE